MSRAESEYAYRLLDEAHQEARRRVACVLGQTSATGRDEALGLEVRDREILGCECDAEIHRPVPLVRRFGLRREIGLMKREHLGTVGTKTTGQCVDECGDATRFTDHDATSLEAVLTAKTLGLANLGDGLLSRASSGETPERHHGVGPDDTIRVRPWLAWKLRTADSVSGPKMPST